MAVSRFVTASPGSRAVSLLGVVAVFEFRHSGGHLVKVIFWFVQSTLGLWHRSHKCPMITVCRPRLVTANLVHSWWDPICKRICASSVIIPFSFKVPSMLWTGIGDWRGVVSMLCFWTKSRFTNMPVVPESRSADVDTDWREVVAHNTTMTFSEWGEFLDKT